MEQQRPRPIVPTEPGELLPEQWERRRRTLHLVDIENLVGPGHELGDRFEFEYALAEYAEFSQMDRKDPVMIGCHPGLLFPAQAALGSRGQIFTGHGEDGADKALLEAAEAEFVAARFHLVSIGSGDHIFADLARKLRDRGVRVTVVARRGRTAAELREAAHDYIAMPELGSSEETVTSTVTT